VSATSFIVTSDGVRIAIRDVGPRDATPILFLYGIAQSLHVWDSVLAGPLARDMRLIALDLRGHGDSDKPERDAAYVPGNRLGEDLFDVIRALGLARPILVAWSYGGIVVGEYLRAHGSEDVGGILFAAAVIKLGRPARPLLGPVMLSNGRVLMSDDDATYDAGARTFIAGCPGSPIDPMILEQSLQEMKRVPAHVRRTLLSRHEDFSEEVARCTAPIATLHGTLDQVVLPAMSDCVASLNPAIENVRIENIGHLLMVEAPIAFENAVRVLAARRR
jgi:pimeloyl-ACP methyl ester carboxylesterase